jgi:hypothetical protein
MDLHDITREDFEAYERVRQSGLFNMIMQQRDAAYYAGLDLSTYQAILENYQTCLAKWPDVRAQSASNDQSG